MRILDKTNYNKLGALLGEVTINHLFARAVVEKKVQGTVYVDNADAPQTAYVIHPYGMSLLFGKHDNNDFNAAFKEYALNHNHKRDKHEWMQAFPREWDAVLHDLFAGHSIKSVDNTENKRSTVVEINTRVNFKFNRDVYLRNKHDDLPGHCVIVRADKTMFESMKGAVIPAMFWNSADDFCKNSAGYCLFYDNKLATMSFAAFMHDAYLEIGIETLQEFRGKGYATAVCSALIEYCLENSYMPVWACRLENSNSYRLAERLGFEEIVRLPYYKLSN